jgi:hypothetical protein
MPNLVLIYRTNPDYAGQEMTLLCCCILALFVVAFLKKSLICLDHGKAAE